MCAAHALHAPRSAPTPTTHPDTRLQAPRRRASGRPGTRGTALGGASAGRATTMRRLLPTCRATARGHSTTVCGAVGGAVGGVGAGGGVVVGAGAGAWARGVVVGCARAAPVRHARARPAGRPPGARRFEGEGWGGVWRPCYHSLSCHRNREQGGEETHSTTCAWERARRAWPLTPRTAAALLQPPSLHGTRPQPPAAAALS